ncbi:hypothetical protein BN946_scf185013.g17 [Trametes cinnabarina]|uniref:Uncharacterized protein n=1 Tax=Pycnoporus cinnabarinus TaxID=5643 RepID=A0A060SLT2_PYCCI|nr:hypothetical protein BN946_scf185013.g17 [Trametes cinnabarina]
MSLLKAWKSVTSINGTAPSDSPPTTLTPKRKARFSLRIISRQSPRRAAQDFSRSASDSPFWTSPNASTSVGRTAPRFELPGIGTRAALKRRDGRDGRDVTLERSFTLSVLEGRRIAEVRRLPKGSTGTDDTCVGSTNGEDTIALVSSGSPKASPPPPIPPRSRARSASLGSAHSQSEDRRSRRVRPRPQTIGLPELAEPRGVSDVSAESRWASKPPTYSATAHPTHAVAYRFAQTGAFETTLEAESRTKEKGELSNGMWRYHIAAGVNVLTLRSWVTSVRRGGEDGLLVAEIESGLVSSGCDATVTMGDGSRLQKDVLSKTVGCKMYYLGDGTSIRWNLGETKWEAFFDSVPLATFDPGPARRLVMQPVAHRIFDHLVVAVLLLMREEETV